MKYIEKYLKDIIKVKPLGKLTTEEDELDGISGEMVYIDGKCSDIFIAHIDYANWLEKQSNKSINIDIESMVSSYKQRLKSQAGIRMENNPLVNMCLSAFRRGVENTLEEINLNKLEKQGEQEFINSDTLIQQRVDTLADIDAKQSSADSVKPKVREEKVDNQNCVKSVYNDEPKFKAGDWVVFDNGNVEHITSVGTHGYTFDDGDYLLHDECDKIAHLWSIQDAKDGDVLLFEGFYNSIVLFQGIGINGKGRINYHCKCDLMNYSFGVQGDFACLGTIEKDAEHYHPATKEQRDLLFQKMKEAEYIFDFKNKELKKIKNDIEIPFGAKDSELQEAIYHIPKGFHAEIDDDKVVIKKGEKPTAWMEEDGKRIQRISDFIWKNRKGDTDDIYQQEQDVKWLKSLKGRVGCEANCTTIKEWSKEDEHRVKDTIYFLDTAKKHYASTVELEACIDWLKTLKQRIGG